MNKKILGVFVSLLAVAMLALPMSTVYATKPQPVAGAYFPTGGDFVQRQAGKSDNIIIDVSGPHIWMGSFAGSSYSESRWVWHKSSDPEEGFLTFSTIYTLNVGYDGLTGTLTIKSAGNNWRIISGTGDLANLRGQGTFYMINITIFLVGYEGQVHFDP